MEEQVLAPAKETTVYKVQIKNNREDPPPGAQATSGFVLSLFFSRHSGR